VHPDPAAGGRRPVGGIFRPRRGRQRREAGAIRYVIVIFGTAMFLLYDGFYRDWGITRSAFAEIGRLLSYVF
jgi:hypothetical protein